MAVIDIERAEYAGEVHMPPGLRPIGGGGEVGRDRPADVAVDCGARAGAGLAIAGRGDRPRAGAAWERADVRIRGYDPGRRQHGGERLFRRHRESAAVRSRKGVAHLRDALAAGRAHRAAEFQRFGVGVGIGEVRESLAAEEAAQRAVGVSEARDQAVAASLLHGLAAEIVAAGPVELKERPRLSPGCRGAGLDVEPRLLRAEHEHPIAARMVRRLRDIAEAGDELGADRHRIQVAVLTGVGRGGAGIRGVLHPARK